MKMRFNDKQISYLKSHKTLKYADQSFFEYLKRFRFTGTVWAVPEGTVLFPNEDQHECFSAATLKLLLVSFGSSALLYLPKLNEIVFITCLMSNS